MNQVRYARASVYCLWNENTERERERESKRERERETWPHTHTILATFIVASHSADTHTYIYIYKYGGGPLRDLPLNPSFSLQNRPSFQFKNPSKNGATLTRSTSSLTASHTQKT